MSNKKAWVAVLTATTFIAAGTAFAESQPASTQTTSTQTTSQQTTADKDFGKLSAAGSRAYQDVTLARLAIFDGKTNDAKKYIADANTAFATAKTDESVFTKAEADLKTADQVKKAGAKGATATAAPEATTSDASKSDAAKTPIAWLPVDGVIGLNEDYSLTPMKAKAVADANKSLEAGDRKGAMDKLKLADVDMNVVLAVVPLNQTISDVQQAAQLIDGGKYYEGSQELRKIDDATRYDVSIYNATPAAGAAKADAANSKTSVSDAKAPASSETTKTQ